MNLLFLSWKDIKDPQAGGAEVVLWNYAKGCAKQGHQVTWVTSLYTNAKHTEINEGVRIKRYGTLYSVYFKFYKHFRQKINNQHYDLIIDAAGGIPFLTPLYVNKIPIIYFIHHIGDKEWQFKYNTCVGSICKLIFSSIIKLYKSCHTITVSNSTKNELIEKFHFQEQKVHVIENALDIDTNHNINIFDKKDTILFYSRIMPIKRLEHAIKAFHYFSLSNKNYILNVIGPYENGKYFERIQALVKKLNLEDKIIFQGGISLEERSKISSNKILLIPSYKEGYGLVVLEGNVYGIPAIGYNVPGIRDSIKHGKNGYKVKDGDYKGMGKLLNTLIKKPKKYKSLIRSSFEHVKNHNTWDENIHTFLSIVKSTYKKENK